MQIEAGKFYRTRDGRKVGPIELWRGMFSDEGGTLYHSPGPMGGEYWQSTGVHAERSTDGEPDLDLIALWEDEPASPVRTVTRTEIVPGTYGRVSVEKATKDTSPWGDAYVALVNRQGKPHDELALMTVAELRAAAKVFTQLADALDEQAATP